ncbi:transcriptional regulator, DeoR family [Pseudomonas chlororaphis subsp. aurantiaca]|uniref:DeoR/GlpR family DNA-binding transcription regulator n=1 Tax=Pseudomonas chlororaphis TaxID=587753 RepID=UPI0008666FA9|nr:DeoR/GlpR family DNA-binding transcription regulator [Pseudomonas chlororaphis]BAV74432.1 transcriptional regulator, DeoR family [Pseudomonas chlororaphis subsp. aurantiaca]
MQNQHSVAELPHVRRQKILLLLERDGKVMASELGQHFAVSEDTIRRDLAELADAGLLQRVHGGALPRPKDTGKDVFTRLGESSEVKRHLARLGAQRVQEGQIVMFDSGSTTLLIAQSLPADIGITSLHFDEVPVKQALLDSASQVVAVTTADKLGAVEPFAVAPCNRLHTLITEQHLASGSIDDYRRLGIEVVQAPV